MYLDEWETTDQNNKQNKEKNKKINQLHFLHQAADLSTERGCGQWPHRGSEWPEKPSGRFKMLSDKVSQSLFKRRVHPQKVRSPFALLILIAEKIPPHKIKSQHFRLVLTKIHPHKPTLVAQRDKGTPAFSRSINQVASRNLSTWSLNRWDDGVSFAFSPK